MSERGRAGAVYYMGHGLGNDYLVFEAGGEWPLSPEAIEAVCDRRRGVGSDGIVLVLDGGPRSSLRDEAFHLRMFNPDGSEFERSGNGLRIFAAFAASRGWVDREPFSVEVGGDRVRLQVLEVTGEGFYDVVVEMGPVSFLPEVVGFDAGQLEPDGHLHHPQLGRLDIQPVSVGNPHCVAFVDALSDPLLERLGPFLAHLPAFFHGTNVQLARVVGPQEVEILIWERGVGRTSASGTSACATASACVRRGLLEPGAITVTMEGGSMEVTVSPEWDIRLRGPVQEIGTGELGGGFVGWLTP